MSASGYTPIYLYNSGTSTNTPSSGNLGNGELAINYADGRIFYKNSSGVVNLIGGSTVTTAAATTTTLTALSTRIQKISGSTTQTVQLPAANTLPAGQVFIIDNDATGNVTVNDNSSTLVTTVYPGNMVYLWVEDNSTAAGSWGKYAFIPSGTYVASGTTGSLLTTTGSGSSLTFGSGSLSLGGNLTTSGAFATTLTTTATTSLTLPTSGTVTALGNTTTGSGSIVLATSPTLTTPTLGVASATTINKVTLTAPATGSTLTIADGKTLTANNSITFSGTDSTTMTLPPVSASLGYLGIPQNSQSAAYTTVLGDAGYCIFHPSSDANARTFTIAANASVAYPLGTVIQFINMSASNVTIAISSDTLTWAQGGGSGSRTLAQYGVANCIKIATTQWLITGTNLT